MEAQCFEIIESRIVGLRISSHLSMSIPKLDGGTNITQSVSIEVFNHG